MKQFVLILTVLLLVALVWSQLDSTAVTQQAGIIAVEGNGEFEVMPDTLTLHYNVSALHDNDVSVAKSEVDQAASASVRALMKLGVKEADITSSALNVTTLEDYNRDDGSRIRRHRVQRNVEAVLRDVSLYNRALQVLVDSGVSEISHIQPEVSNYDALKQQALGNAAKDARQQAEFLAEQFDARIARVHKIGRQNIQRHFGMEERLASAAKGGDSSAPPSHDFKPAKVKVSSTVFVEFELE